MNHIMPLSQNIQRLTAPEIAGMDVLLEELTPDCQQFVHNTLDIIYSSIMFYGSRQRFDLFLGTIALIMTRGFTEEIIIAQLIKLCNNFVIKANNSITQFNLS